MAAGTQDLDGFVREALAAGASKDAIGTALASAGWPEAMSEAAWMSSRSNQASL